MKVLTVCREIPQNLLIHKQSIAEFIFEQNTSLEKYGVDYDYFLIKRGGIPGYLNEIRNLHRFLKERNYNYSLIHAHGGHIGSLANTQRKIPVITTFHGSDINDPANRLISLFAIMLSKTNIFVSPEIFYKVRHFTHSNIIPCGVDFDIFNPIDKVKSRQKLGLNQNDKIVLFAGRRDRTEKNYKLAEEAANMVNINDFIELKDYTREEVKLLLNACDVLLLTSVSEGSPQVIKEAMACNCPIVATDVGDIRQIISNTEGCYITSFNPSDVAEKIKLALKFNKRTNGRNTIKHLDTQVIALKILELYQQVTGKEI